MGLLALALAALLAPQEPAAASGDVTVSVPPAQATIPAAPPVEPVPVAVAPQSVVGIPAQEPPRVSRPLEDRVESGPSVGGFVVGSFAVVGLLGGALLLLRRFGKNSRFLGNGGAIKILARKPLGPKQEVFLLEVGARVFMIGSTRESLSTLGEFSGPDEVARLRAELPGGKEESHRGEFRESLREGLKDEEAPREERVFASIADELAEIRKTVRAWRA
jgi:flagellar biosynthetic protein FliO